MILVSPALAQSDEASEPEAAEAHGEADAHGGEHGAMETHEGTEAHGGGAHDVFPPFDTTTWGSQLIWLAITFGLLFYLMSRVALPRIASILENRSKHIAGDLAAAGRMKDETDAAIAGYEQALAEARKNAHAIAQTARDAAKAEVDADRAKTEGALQKKLDEADARIAEVKTRALAEVDAIARDTAEAMVVSLVGGDVTKGEVAAAVEAAIAERT